MEGAQENITSVHNTVASTFDFTKQSWRDDVTFLVEDKRLYASKTVLAIISPVFESMFGTCFKEKTGNEVPLPGKKPDDFLEFLHCVYPTSNRTVTRKNVFQVLPLAHEYQVEQLVEKCNDVLEKYITDEEEEFDIKDLLTCYTIATRYNLARVHTIALEKILNDASSAHFNLEAEKNMEKDTQIKLQREIITEQAKRIDDLTTKLVRLYLNKSGINTDGLENSMGAIIEHTLGNVFDPVLFSGVPSTTVMIWNASFTLDICVCNTEGKTQTEKCLSVYLRCDLPDDKLSCDVKAVLILENVFAAKNRIIKSENVSIKFQPESCTSWGFPNFERLSKFLTGTPENVENYTGKITAYILAKHPE